MFEISEIRSIEIEKALKSLSLPKQIAFSASCCERLLPNYRAFSLMERWGDYETLRNVLDLIWTGVIEEKSSIELSKVPLENIVRLAPDCDDFTTIFTSLAGDAVASLVYTIGACFNAGESIKKIRLVLQVTENSLYEYLAVVNDSRVGVHTGDIAFEESILQYPLMIAEFEKQRSDLTYLRENEQLNESVISHLRSSSSRSGIQPIERGLVKRFAY